MSVSDYFTYVEEFLHHDAVRYPHEIRQETSSGCYSRGAPQPQGGPARFYTFSCRTIVLNMHGPEELSSSSSNPQSPELSADLRLPDPKFDMPE